MVNIVCQGLYVSIGKRPVLHGIDATLGGGALIGVIGPNGAGKSTFARALLGLLKPAQGSISIDRANVQSMKRTDIARTIAYLSQGQTLHWPLSVERLIALGRLPHLAPFSRITQADTDAIEHAMMLADVGDLRHRIASELSGGERARVLLARALAVEAPALIADEPLASLDPGHQIEVMELLKAQAKAGKLVITVLHDLTMAARFCDRLLLLNGGRLIADGSAASVLTAERLADVYGVEAWIGSAGDIPMIVPLHRKS